jgi:hypothetical protein
MSQISRGQFYGDATLRLVNLLKILDEFLSKFPTADQQRLRPGEAYRLAVSISITCMKLVLPNIW